MALTFDTLYDLGGSAGTVLVWSPPGTYSSWVRPEIFAHGRHLATYQDGTTYFAHAGALGAERLRTKPDGSVYETCVSLPFGDQQSCSFPNGAGSDSPLHFTGKPRDPETGLDDFDARYNNSTLGRFLTPDPLGGQLQDPQSLNRYVYARNNPVTLTDSTGLSFALDCAKDNGTTCQGGHVYYQDKNGKYQETITNSDKNGNLTDQNKNKYSGTFDGKSVTFTGPNGAKSTGDWIQGSDETKGILGSGSLSGFNFTFENHGSGQTLNTKWTFSGSVAQAEAALEKAGFGHYFLDVFDPDHPATLDYMTFGMRSAGDPGTGANSGHFIVHEPYIFGPYGRIPLRETVPATGDAHFGEHNPLTGGFLAHQREIAQ